VPQEQPARLAAAGALEAGDAADDSKGALADEALQLWDQAEALLEERVDGQCLAEGGERLARLILLDADEANACERTEVPGLQGQRSVAVGERAVVFADEVEHGGALVPALGPIWQASRMGMAIAGTLPMSRIACCICASTSALPDCSHCLQISATIVSASSSTLALLRPANRASSRLVRAAAFSSGTASGADD